MLIGILHFQENSVNVTSSEVEDGLKISAQNLNPYPVTINIQFDLTNMKSPVGNIIKVVLSAKSEQEITTLTIAEANKRYGYNTRFSYFKGDYRAQHDNNYVYQFPFRSGSKYRLDQGYNGSFSHQNENRYALDFYMPEGTEIFSAREGVVVDLKKDSNVGGAEERFRDQSNYISILHEDGTFGDYVHLRQNGVTVSIGQRVVKGQLIGYSGSTGYASGPHLHFQVSKVDENGKTLPIPTQFGSPQGKISVFEEGVFYTAH